MNTATLNLESFNIETDLSQRAHESCVSFYAGETVAVHLFFDVAALSAFASKMMVLLGDMRERGM